MVIVFGFLAAFLMTILVALSMAEISSAYPAAGGVYNWTAQVLPSRHSPFASYICGWMSLFGYVSVSAVIAATFSGFFNAALTISEYPTLLASSEQVFLSIGLLFLAGLINMTRIDEVGILNAINAFVHIASLVLLITLLAILPTQRASSEFVFTQYFNTSGSGSQIYVSAIGLILPAFIFSGYDSCAILAEETSNAELTTPRSLLTSVVLAGCLGFALLLALLYATLDIQSVLQGSTEYPIMNVFDLYLTKEWAIVLAWVLVVNLFLGLVTSVGVSARIAFALSRDQGLPFSFFMAKTHTTLRSPINAIFFVSIFGCMELLFLFDPNTKVAFETLVGLSVVGQQVSYAIPILVKVIYMPVEFPRTAFSLGDLSRPIGALACVWLLSLSALAFLPTQYPVTTSNMNWSCVVAVAYFTIALLNWHCNSKYYFEGPKRVAKDDAKLSTNAAHSVVDKTRILRKNWFKSPPKANEAVHALPTERKFIDV